MEDMKGSSCSSKSGSEEIDEMEMEMELRRGPWTVEEDLTLINYIASHGEGRWNSLARFAGLKRTGKSCRLRWLNYLRPDVRRGNITLEEQLLILELHSRWGNRWSKIAQHLPGRTDNEIKNYWRTRVQKHAKQLKCDVNSKQFKDTMRYLWMPRLVERIQAASASASASADSTSSTTTAATNQQQQHHHLGHNHMVAGQPEFTCNSGYTPENSSTAASSDSFGAQVSPVSDQADYYIPARHNPSPANYFQTPAGAQFNYSETLISPNFYGHGLDIPEMEHNNLNQWVDQGHTTDNLWNVDDDFLFLQQQFNYSNI